MVSKKFLISFSSILLTIPFLVFANGCPTTTCPAGGVCFPNPLCYETVEELIEAIITILLYVAVVICPLLMVIGAFHILVSAGDPNKVKTGKNMMLWAAIGLLIILFAKGAVALLRYILPPA